MSRRTDGGATRPNQIPLTRPRGSAAWRRALLPAGALALAMTAAGPALADTASVTITQMDNATIKVMSDGEKYTQTDPSSPTLKGMIDLYLDTEVAGRVRSWSVTPRMYVPILGDDILGVNSEKSQTYPRGSRPKIVNRSFPFTFLREDYKDYVKDACNALAHDLRDEQGLTDQEIFKVDRELVVLMSPRLAWDASGPKGGYGKDLTEVIPGEYAGDDHSVKILCKRKPFVPLELKVIASKLAVEAGNISSGLQSQCVLRLVGAITVTRSDMPVTFRYVDETGKESDVKTIGPVPGLVKPIQHIFMHAYPLNHVVGEKNEGKIRMVGENTDFTSDWVNYDIDCSAPTNDLLVALPPEVHALKAVPAAQRTTIEGHICPERVMVAGDLKGRGKAAGTAFLSANKHLLNEIAYDINVGEFAQVAAIYDLSWDSQNMPSQEVEFEVIVVNTEGEPVERRAATETFECEPIIEGTLDLTPPKPTHLEAVALDDKVNFQGNICPARMRVSGGLKGQGIGVGRVLLHVDGVPRAEQAYEVMPGEVFKLGGEHVFSWNRTNVNNHKVKLELFIFNAEGEQVDYLTANETFKCEQIVQGTLVLTPPKVTHIEANAPAEKFSFQNYTCPARVRVAGVVKGQGLFSGTALVAVNNQPVTETPFNINEGQTQIFEGDQELTWNNNNASGQKVWFRLVVLDDNKDVVDVLTASKTFKCDAAIGGKGVEIPTSQPTNDKATAQTNLNFSIVAPRNQVRNGQIRLSGTKPDQVFKLRFLYKTNSGGFKIFKSSQLPKQMTGGTASFNLDALKAGIWRLRACPVKAGATIPKLKDCKSSDFKVLAAGTFQAPAGDPQQSPTYSIIPNIGG